ncbi:MAG TPA: hypothetical protein VF792_00730 [Ktedonobacterales bacterium]
MADQRDLQRPAAQARPTVDAYTTHSTGREVADERTWVLSRNIRQPLPYGAPRPSILIDLLRPDDLVNLSIECYNIRLDLSDPAHPALVRDSYDLSAFLAVQFPSQHVEEQAYFEARKANGDPSLYDEPPFETGRAGAHAAGPSRLVFRLPDSGPGSRIPYSTKALLDWAALIPQLSPRAATPDETPAGIAAQMRAPGVLETAIELPYRLLLSPDRSALWTNAVEPVTHAGRTEVWHTRLALPGGSAPVATTAEAPAYMRALWSLDYSTPTARNWEKVEPGGFRSSMTAYDRRQVVRLSSDFSLTYKNSSSAPATPAAPYGGYTKIPGVSVATNAAQQPLSIAPEMSPVSGAFQDITVQRDRSAVELVSPTRPIEVEQLMLSPLGGWLKSRGAWDPIGTEAPAPDPESFTVSEWRHIASQGRDEFVRVVYEGYLFPFGHRAALIKVTERKFQSNPSGPMGGTPYAYLRQHEYIVVRQPTLTYPETAFANAGREMPYKKIEIKTLVTPDTLPPDAPTVAFNPTSTNSPFAWMLPAGYPAFWIKTADGPFPFHVQATSAYGETNDFTATLAFVIASGTPLPKTAAPHIPLSDAALTSVISAYDAASVTSALSGQRLTYAPPLDGHDTTTLTTDALMFTATSSPQVAAGFVPCLRQADVRLTSVEHLLGAPTTTTIKYFSDYLAHGYDDGPGIFAEFMRPVATIFSAEKGGGISMPNMSLVGLSQKTGPVGGKSSDPHTSLQVTVKNEFRPKEYFEEAAAKFLGKISLADMFEIDPFADRHAPKITTQLDPPGVAVPKAVITSLEWNPVISGPKTVGELLQIDQHSVFKLVGSITRPLTSVPSEFSFQGSLTSFKLQFSKIIVINFDRFAFTSQSGQKPNVSVDLSGDHPVQFDGPLRFLNTLEDVIAAGGFGGNGPYLHVNTAGVTVGYSLAIPPVSVGVLSLQHAVFDASLTLPFLDGTPLIDFNFASRSHPFLLTVEAFAGGGYLHVQLDSEVVRIVEGAFEFGGNFALDLGVASGGVHILAGIYLRLTNDPSTHRSTSDLTGFVRMGGELSVLDVISASLEFDLDLSYYAASDGTGGEARGQATLTVAVHVAFFSTSVELTVERSYGGTAGDPTLDEIMAPSDWASYAAAFA